MTASRRLRVALVHPFPWTEVRRGGERYLADLAWYLHRAGHLVEVVVGAGRRPRRTVVDGITVRVLPRVAPGLLARRGLTAVETHGLVAVPTLLRHRYDVVHSLTPSGALAGRLSRHPTVYTELGIPDIDEMRTRPGAEATYRLVMRTATVVAGLGPSARDAVERVGRRSAEILTPGVRLDVFTPSLAPRTGPPRLLFMADASEVRKGADVLIAALLLVLVRHPDARLVFGGPGDHRWALPAEPAARRRAEAAIDVLGVGAHEEVAQRYRAATVTVLPSRHEAFGLVLAESHACGTPVVCSDTGGMPEVAGGADVARLAPVGDVDGLAAAIVAVVDLARDPATPARCVTTARRWGWVETVGPSHEDLYRRVAAT